MLKKIVCAAVVLAMLCVPVRATDVSAECAILMDCMTGRVFFQKNAATPHLIASTTKIMTALVALENCGLDDVVKIGSECERVEGSSMYLRAGEEMTAEELLYGLLLLSGNDAAMALAMHCGGVDEFVALMNEKAAELGLKNTSFANPHGLDAANNYSTAEDMAHLAARAMENEDFARICGTKNVSAAGRFMTNHNKLLWQLEGAMGVKTGYTKAAGRCLVSCAERMGRRLVAVTLNAPGDWDDHAMLYNAVFSAIEERELAVAGTVAARVPVAGGGTIAVLYGEGCRLAFTQDEYAALEIRLELPHFVYNTDPGGDAGYVRVYLQGVKCAEIPLIYAE